MEDQVKDESNNWWNEWWEVCDPAFLDKAEKTIKKHDEDKHNPNEEVDDPGEPTNDISSSQSSIIVFVLFRAIWKGAEPDNESWEVYNEVKTSNCEANNFYDVTKDL